MGRWNRLIPSLLAALAALSASPALAADKITAIVGGTLIHPEQPGAPAEKDVTVIISGDRIQSVGPSKTTPLPKGATVIKAQGKWILPGLIDSHVHFFQSGDPFTRPDAIDATKIVPYAKEVARNKARLPATFKVWLASGVTSVADVGGPFWNFDARDAAVKSKAAPRVAIAGPLTSMIDRPQLDLGDPPIIKITSPEAAKELAATELEVAKASLRAGADVLVHSVADVPIDAEFISLAKKRNAIYVPTLFVREGYVSVMLGEWKPTPAEQRLADPEILKQMNALEKVPKDQLPTRVAQLRQKGRTPANMVDMKNLRPVWDAGITVAMGTDAGKVGTLHGPSVFREMQLMRDAGLSMPEVLLSATLNGAKVMGMDRELGTVQPGMLADLIILNADPLQSVDNLSKVHRTIKGGVIYDPVKLMRSIR